MPWEHPVSRKSRPLPNLSVVRERKGISIDQIAQSTRIRAYYLVAIEEGRLEELPAGIYSRSYVRQYAEAIGFAPDELLEYFS